MRRIGVARGIVARAPRPRSASKRSVPLCPLENRANRGGSPTSQPVSHRLNQSAFRKIPHELRYPKGPGLAVVRMTHPVAEGTELIRFNFHKVADLVAEPH